MRTLMRTPNRKSSSLEVLRSWFGTMPCVGSLSVWSSLRGEAMPTSIIGEYGPYTNHTPPRKRPESPKGGIRSAYQESERGRGCVVTQHPQASGNKVGCGSTVQLYQELSVTVSRAMPPRKSVCSERGLRSSASSPSTLVSSGLCCHRARRRAS